MSKQLFLRHKCLLSLLELQLVLVFALHENVDFVLEVHQPVVVLVFFVGLFEFEFLLNNHFLPDHEAQVQRVLLQLSSLQAVGAAQQLLQALQVVDS